ncbi:hypothetical protein BDK51DRAFT_31469 [Blyttiomyces helicus]|uniref:Uncharacterized protein n=1 Tax=Blyttiomyces helicus TaxID=388810 RepID=A0A4V1ISQ3_9FUNG|nr:hypothetical protein BDK51DRAFT_31469 [Blyttiomyces helicus]|eukprot:RKO94357.1 hypothetical protein BDK51DRAFT_31469 [Blyttiomyces helicus]
MSRRDKFKEEKEGDDMLLGKGPTAGPIDPKLRLLQLHHNGDQLSLLLSYTGEQFLLLLRFGSSDWVPRGTSSERAKDVKGEVQIHSRRKVEERGKEERRREYEGEDGLGEGMEERITKRVEEQMQEKVKEKECVQSFTVLVDRSFFHSLKLTLSSLETIAGKSALGWATASPPFTLRSGENGRRRGGEEERRLERETN